jgi:hypothetical protein
VEITVLHPRQFHSLLGVNEGDMLINVSKIMRSISEPVLDG